LKKIVLNILKYSIFLFIGLLLLWLVYRKVDLQQMLTEIRNANYWWILLTFVCAVLSHISRAMRWNILIGSLGYHPKTITTFYAVMMGYFANTAIPRVGEITRCGVLSRTEKIPVNSLIGTVVAERVFDMITLLVILFFVVVFQLKLLGSFLTKYMVQPMSDRVASNMTPILVALAFIVLFVAVAIFLFKTYRKELRRNGYYRRARDLVKGFLTGMKTIGRMQHKKAFFLHTVFIWTCYFLMTYLCFFSMDSTSHLKVIDGITVLAVGSLGIAAPVPAGIGAYHFIVKAILCELYLIPAAAAGSFAAITWSSQILLIILLGAFSYFMLLTTKNKTNHEQA